jgi:hypothetical protein
MKPFTVARVGRLWWVLCEGRCRWATNLPEAFAIASALQR